MNELKKFTIKYDIPKPPKPSEAVVRFVDALNELGSLRSEMLERVWYWEKIFKRVDDAWKEWITGVPAEVRKAYYTQHEWR